MHQDGNPDRPIINSLNCHTSTISEYVDYQLKPIVKQIPLYVKELSDFVS